MPSLCSGAVPEIRVGLGFAGPMRNFVSKKSSGKWNHLFICPDRTLFQNLTTLLAEITAGSSLIDLRTYPHRRQIHDIVRQQRPNLCFLDVGSNRDDALAVLNEFNSVAPGLPVVAIHASNDPDLILRCLRQGAREFLFQPFSHDQVSAAVERLEKMLREANVSEREIGKVYCVMPGKGASGATTIASALALQFHRLAGKDKKTLLADLDPSTGTLSFQLKLKSTFSFLEALNHAMALDESIWKAIVTSYQGIDVILSPETPNNGQVEHSDPTPIVDYARDLYGTIVIDSRGPYGEWGSALARCADELILVTTNELPTLHATQRALAYLDRGGVESTKIRLVVNRFNPDSGLGREAIETALHHEVFEILASDSEAVNRSLLDGKPLAANSGVGKGIARIAERLAGKATPAAKTKSLLSGIFSVFQNKL